MKDYSEQHKIAWEYDAYDFWVRHEGTPEERAREDVADPRKMLRKYAQYFDQVNGVKIANICGSCGKKAIPLMRCPLTNMWEISIRRMRKQL